MSQPSRRAGGLIEPCLLFPAQTPPSGADWLHEIKHDGFRILALRDAAGVPLYTHNGNDFTKRFPLAVAAVARPLPRTAVEYIVQRGLPKYVPLNAA